MESSGNHHSHEPHSPDPGDAVSVFIDSGTPLPDGYGDHRLVVLSRDPHCFFAYWEIQPGPVQTLRHTWGARLEQATTILRVFDVTHLDESAWASATWFDVEIQAGARQWYVHVGVSGRQYMVELGYRLPDGTFISLLRSNLIWLPLGRVSDEVDTQWMAVRSSEEYEAWEKVLHNVDIGRGSAEFSRQMAQRWQFLKSVFSLPTPPSSFVHMPSSMPSSMPGSGSRR